MSLSPWATVTEPTVLMDVPESEYHAGGVRTPGPQTSQSALKLLIAPSTPREFQHRLTNPMPPRRAFDVGHAAHAVVLGVGAEFTACPPALLDSAGRMSRTVAKEWADQERAAGRTPLHPDDYDAVYRMADAILAHPEAAELFTDPARRAEVSAFFEVTPGLWLRSRFDLLGGDLVDFKTSAYPRPERFRKAAWDLGYHVQDEAYRRAWEAVTGKTAGPMRFVVVGKEAPHLVGIYQLDAEFQRLGAEQLDASIARYLEQLDKHGAPTAPGVVWDGIPAGTTLLSPPRSAYWDATDGVEYEPEF